MKVVFDRDGEKKGVLRKLDDIPTEYLKSILEPFVRNGCYIYEFDIGKYAAIPGWNAIVKEVEE